MKFDLLIDCITDLLYKHNCIIIPGFGGFITNYEQAGFEESRHLINPSRKKVAFNQNLKENDGLLVSQWGKLTQKSYQEALDEVKSFVSHLNGKIQSDKSYDFKNIGTLYLNHENNLIFIPHQGINFLESSFGLYPVKIKPLAVRSSVITNQIKTEDNNPAPVIEQDAFSEQNKEIKIYAKSNTGYRSLLKAASYILLLTVAGFSTYYFVNKSQIHKYSASSPKNQEASMVTAGIEKTAKHSEVRTSTSKKPDYKSERTKLNNIKTQLNEFAENNLIARESYEVILGNFDSEAKANTLITKLITDYSNAQLIGSSESGFFIMVESFYQYTTAESFSVMLKQSGYKNVKIEKKTTDER